MSIISANSSCWSPKAAAKRSISDPKSQFPEHFGVPKMSPFAFLNSDFHKELRQNWQSSNDPAAD
jgi:hypothetical protein